MSKGLLKYNYPQIVFAKEIAGYVLASGKTIKTIIDCPCGNGETAFNLAAMTKAKVIAADISAESIQKAKINFPHPNVEYKVDAIESVLNSQKQFEAFCIVNSLFLLENYDQILKNLTESLKSNEALALIIIPNTEGKNFKWFQSKGTDENKLILGRNEIEPFFNKYGLITELIKPICYTHHYNRTDVKLFSVFWSLYLSFLNGIQTSFKIGKPNYFLIALATQEK